MIDFGLLESFTDWGRLGNEIWADSIGIFQKPIWNEQDYFAFNRKYLAAHEILPLALNTTLPPSLHQKSEPSILQNTEPSILQNIGRGRMTSTMEKIRIEVINQNLPLWFRLRGALSLVLGRKNTLILNNLLGRTQHEEKNSWGTNTNILSD
jgi:hypothetical protein